MPPLPTGAPTTGNAALIYWSLLGAAAVLFVVIGALKYFYPSGKDRLAHKEKDESESVTILLKQVEELKAQLSELRSEVDELREEREADREARHRQNNKVQALMAWCELYYDLIQEIKAEWNDMPPHFARRLEQMRKPSDVLRRFD